MVRENQPKFSPVWNVPFTGRCKATTAIFLDGRGNMAIPDDSCIFSLSTRERQVAEAVFTEGFADKELATRFGVSRQTIKNHMASILKRLNIHNRGDIVGKFIKERGVYFRPSVDAETTTNPYIRVWARDYLNKGLKDHPGSRKKIQRYVEDRSAAPFTGFTPIQVDFLAFYGRRFNFDYTQLEKIMGLKSWKSIESILPPDLKSDPAKQEMFNAALRVLMRQEIKINHNIGEFERESIQKIISQYSQRAPVI